MINSRKDLENYIRADRQRNIGSIGFLKYRLGLFMKSESCIAIGLNMVGPGLRIPHSRGGE